MRCLVSCSSTSFPWLVFLFGALLWSLWITSIEEDRCDKGAHPLYLGTERNIPVIPNWFQPCKCCCCLCYPGECLWLGTSTVMTEPRYLKHVTVPSFCLVGVVISLVFSALISMPQAVETLSRRFTYFLPVLPLLLSHQCHQQSRDWWLSASNADSAFMIF